MKFFSFLNLLISINAAAPARKIEVQSENFDWAVLLKDAGGNTVCSGVLISDTKVLSARHCFAEEYPAGYKAHFAQQVVGISRVMGLTPDSLPFPNLDLAIAELATRASIKPIMLPSNIDESRMMKEGTLLEAYGFGINPADQSFVKHQSAMPSVLKVVRLLDGFRLRHLAEVKVQAGKRLCRGDSGAAVFSRKGNRAILLGIVSGRLEGVGDFRQKCMEGTDLVTVIAPYMAWLRALEKVDIPQNAADPYPNLDSACIHVAPGTGGAPLVDELLQNYIKLQLQVPGGRRDFTDMLLNCTGLSAVEQQLKNGNLTVVIRRSFPQPMVNIFKDAKRAEVIDTDSSLLEDLTKLPNLNDLTLTGIRWGSSLKPLRKLRLKRLVLRYGLCVKDLDTLKAMAATGVAIAVNQVKPCA